MSPTVAVSPHARLFWGRVRFSESDARRAIRRAILEAPDEAPLYRAYAELAIAEGDPRGEYIRLALLRDEVASADQPPIDEALQTLRARYGRSIYAEWFPTPYAAWLARIAREANEHERWGFVAHVAAPAKDVPSLRALAPLRTIGLFCGEWFRTIVGANADPRPIGRRTIAAPQKIAKQFPDVRSLRFDNLELTAPDVDALGTLAQLESLTFGYRYPVHLEEVLSRADTFPRLTELSLRECAVRTERIGAIASRRGLRSLAVECFDEKNDLEALLGALEGSSLESLTIGGPAPDLYATLDLTPFRTARLPGLRRLWLDEYTLEHADALAESPVFEHLRHLALTGIANGDEVFRALSGAIRDSKIRHLSDRGTMGSYGRYADLAEARAFENLESLQLCGRAESTAALLATMPRLKRLELDDGHFDRELLESVLRMPALRDFHPYWVNMAAEDFVAALVAEKSGEPLRSVDLPDLSKAPASVVHRLVDAASLVELGSLGLTTTKNLLAPATLTLLQRRFGHRLIPDLRARPNYLGDLVYGALPEPDLDPWWSP